MRSPWLTTREATIYAGRHISTIRAALESGTLHGLQPGKNCSWRVHTDCLEAWMGGQPCEHQKDSDRFSKAG